MQHHDDAFPDSRFKLVRWYIGASLVTIGLISVISAEALSRYVTAVMLERDMAVSREFVNSIVRVQKATTYFHGDKIDASRPEMEEFFRHVSDLPDVIRANVYGHNRSIVWSSDPELIGRKFDDNEELEIAFRNEAQPELEVVKRGLKDEHVGFPEGTTQFIENYLPIWSQDGTFIVGAVELYKSPEKLLASIARAKQFIWIGAGAAGLLVFLGLTLVARSAGRILAQQEARTIDAERLAVVGEMTSAVAHGIRNPLASIRSCAEVALEDDLEPDTREAITDIVRQSDRLESWIRSFLTRAHNRDGGDDVARIDDVLRGSFRTFSAQLAQRDINWSIESGDENLLAMAPPEDLVQVFNSLISNGIEAIGRDGSIVAKVAKNGNATLEIEVTDTGSGFTEEALAKMFRPFVSEKSAGLGVGLSLAKRTVERLGGALELGNAPQGGARARVTLPRYAEGTR